ncbi:unnamed protein product [Peniophora sp. CBMAI 1063]|nr:unnamed protein product [Peniophora sp. CBMAI 1063]
MNVVECAESRDLLLYLNAELTGEDIPHRTKITEFIYELFSAQYRKLVHELQEDAISRISFTTDVWSDPQFKPYMAVTAHYWLLSARNQHCRADCTQGFVRADPEPISDAPEDNWEIVDPINTAGLIDEAYTITLNGDVVARVRDLVRACRSSSLRRAGFIAVIHKGNGYCKAIKFHLVEHE